MVKTVHEEDEDPTLTEAPGKKPRDHAPGLLLLLVFAFLIGAGAATLSVMTALSKVNIWVSSSVGLLFAVGFPLFMALRARSALVRRGLKKILRRTTLLLLVVLLQLTLVMVVVFWVGRSGADHARMLGHVVERTLGDVPVVTRTLARLGEDSTLTFADDETGAVAGDGGPAAGSDGGTPSADAGPAPADKPGARGSADAGAPAARPDAGAPAAPPVQQTAAVIDVGGKRELVFVDLDDKGAATFVRQDITGLLQHAAVTQLWPTETGAWVRVGTEGAVFVPRAGAPDWDLKVKDPVEAGTVRAVHDIAPVGEGVLVVADVVDDVGEQVSQALVLSTKKGPLVLRAEGDDVPGEPGGEARRYRILDADGRGRFAIEEEFITGGKSVPVKLTGEKFKMNPRRMLIGDAVAPKALTELWRTGRTDPADDQRTLQATVFAELCGDGSVLFVANTVQNGKKGGWYRAKNADDLRAYGLRTTDKPWGATLSKGAFAIGRQRMLTVDKWGRVLHVDIDADKPQGAVWLRTGQRAGAGKVQRIGAVALADTGTQGVAWVELKAGPALVTFNAEDVTGVPLAQGAPWPEGGKARIADVFFGDKTPTVLGPLVGLR